MPVTIRESGTSDDEYVYLLFIGDEYFELMFEYVSQEHYIDETNNKEIYRYRYNLKENLYFDTYNSLTPNWYYKVLR